MPRNTPRLVAILAAALALSACGDHEDDRGPMQSETRDSGTFDSVEMVGAARLEITVGKPASIVVEARKRSLDRVRTEIRDNTLYIESKPNTWVIAHGRPRVTVRITTPTLASLKLEGGNDVQMSGFSGGAASIKVAGATRMKADGHLQELTVHMAGAGHADLSRLVADEAKVTVDGVGSVVVHPKDKLDATMNGVGAILYTGSPRQVNTRMNGLGTIGQQREQDRGDREHDDEVAPTPESVNPDDLELEREDPKPASNAAEVI